MARVIVILVAVFIFTNVLSYSYAQDVSRDKKLGAEGKAQVESLMGIYKDEEKTKMLTAIGNNLVKRLDKKQFDYQFFIVDTGDPNAFALPGGYIFFTRGILALANNEDELAGVVGHEIIHSNNRHAIKQQKKGFLPGLLQLPGALAGALGAKGAEKILKPLTMGGEAITASHSRKDEYEADELGVVLAGKSGYKPEALAAMLTTLAQSIEIFTGKKETPRYFDDHPVTGDRVQKIKKNASEVTPGPEDRIFKDRKSFLQFIDGVTVGPNPNQGVFKGDWFLHPDMNFKFRLPEVWLRGNSRESVAGIDSTESAVVMLEIETKAKSSAEAAKSFAEQYQKKTGKHLTAETKKVNGNTAHRVSFTNDVKGQQVRATLLWIEYNSLIFKITGAAAPQFEQAVNASFESFAPLTQADRGLITKKVLKIVEARPGESIAQLSERTKNVISAKLTASVNGLAENAVLNAGDLIKIVIEVPY